MNHAQMRVVLRDAFHNVIGRDGTLPELQCLRAISSIESGDGEYWKPPGNGSFNLGAIQKGSGWGGATFVYTDTHPNPDGSSTPYEIAFRKYPTLIEGAEDLVRTVYVAKGRGTVLQAASEGNTLRFSAGLYCPSSNATRSVENAEVMAAFGIIPTGYYQGRGKTPTERITTHHKGVVASIRAQALALSEPLPADIEAMPFKPELLRLGSKGSSVVTLQEQLNRHSVTPLLVVDGNFGEKVRANVIAFQRRSHIVADGIVGTTTWAKLTDGTPAA